MVKPCVIVKGFVSNLARNCGIEGLGASLCSSHALLELGAGTGMVVGECGYNG